MRANDNQAALEDPNNWTSHMAQNGSTYYYNTVTTTS